MTDGISGEHRIQTGPQPQQSDGWNGKSKFLFGLVATVMLVGTTLIGVGVWKAGIVTGEKLEKEKAVFDSKITKVDEKTEANKSSIMQLQQVQTTTCKSVKILGCYQTAKKRERDKCVLQDFPECWPPK